MQELISFLSNKRIAIIGFGKEGKSTLAFLRKYLPENPMPFVLDKNHDLRSDELLEGLSKEWIGENWLDNMPEVDIFIKSPGIVLPAILNNETQISKITSQTELFLRFFGKRTIGITGTKGKSTCSSLIHHIFIECGLEAALAGNIGKPVFELLNNKMERWIILELSSHQLEHCKYSPHIAVLLNIFQEHLDHYKSFILYAKAKLNILNHQNNHDYAIVGEQAIALVNDLHLRIPSNHMVANAPKIESSSDTFKLSLPDGTNTDFQIRKWLLAGDHNIYNLIIALQVALFCQIPINRALDASYNFKGLAHRLQLVGIYNGILFYNDSIATIPEASISAVKSLKNVDTIILGGYNRGIDYSALSDFLPVSRISQIILMGAVGKIILEQIKNKLCDYQKIFFTEDLELAVKYAFENTKEGKICLLSPAAASYDKYKNFEERGSVYTELIKKFGLIYSNKSV